MYTTVATTLGSAPGSLAFARDMFLNVPLIADWQANENLWRANRKHLQYDYAPGQQVLKKVHNPTELGFRTEGPYIIDRVHVNGNLTFILRDGVTKHINTHRVLPYHQLFHFPQWRQFIMNCIWGFFEVFASRRSFSTSSFEFEERRSCFDNASICSFRGRENLVMEGKSVPMLKPFLYTGGSTLEGIKRGLMKYVSVCTYSSINVCYMLISTMVHPIVSYWGTHHTNPCDSEYWTYFPVPLW